MKKVIFLVAVLLSGCSAMQPEHTKPVCYASADMNRQGYSVPIFKVRPVKNQEYLAGAPINGWTNKSQFTDLSQCPNPYS